MSANYSRSNVGLGGSFTLRPPEYSCIAKNIKCNCHSRPCTTDTCPNCLTFGYEFQMYSLRRKSNFNGKSPERYQGYRLNTKKTEWSTFTESIYFYF